MIGYLAFVPERPEMPDHDVLTIEVDRELADHLRQEAAVAGKPVPVFVDELLRLALTRVEPEPEPEPGYDEFLRRKVERARESARQGKVRPHEEVMADMDRLCDRLSRSAPR